MLKAAIELGGTMYALNFYLAINGKVASGAFRKEVDVRRLWARMYAQRLVKDTDAAGVWVGVDMKHAAFHAPIN
jgi:hypothetical protein